MAKYDETENILELYMYLAGDTETPNTWHKWSCLAMVAAALSDRVYYQKLAHKTLPPNMYTMLVGESGMGKGNAIDFGLQFYHPRMNLLYGGTTKQALIDRMSSTPEDDEGDMVGEGVSPSKIFIVHDELGEAVGTGQIADSFIKAMTGWYGQTSRGIEENTRTHGQKIVEDPPCLNWLAGTTHEWLKDAVDVKAMMSGFFGRVCTIPGENDFNNRIYKPVTPDDYELVKVYLQERFEELTYLHGRFYMTPAAEEIDEYWYMNRPEPSEDLKPFWRREHALILKLAMLLSACDSLDRLIHPEHIVGAQDLIKEVRSYMPQVISIATRGTAKTASDKVKAKVWDSALGIARTDLLKYMYNYGVKSQDLDEIIKHLLKLEDIEMTSRAGKTVYIKKLRKPIDWTGL